MKPVFVILFIFILCAVIFVSHFFIYRSWLKFSLPADETLKNIAKILLIILPAAFITTSILATRYDHFTLRSIYVISSFWLGLAANLFFSFALAWFIYGLSKTFHFSLPLPLLGHAFVALGLLITITGTFNAFHPTVKKLNIGLADLPPAWQDKTVVQISDLHLGYIYGQKFARSLVSLVNQQNPDLILITGDLYDGTRGQLEKSTVELKNLRAPFGIYFVNGNHEKFLGLSTVQKLLTDTPIKTLSNELVSLNGLNLVGLEYLGEGSRAKLLEPLTAVPGFSTHQPTVLLYHEPVDIARLQASGIDLMLAGHTHRSQLFPFNFITNLLYHGFDYGFYRLGDFALYVTSGIGSWGPPVRTSARPEIVVLKLNRL